MTTEEGFWLFFPEGMSRYFDMKGHLGFKDEKRDTFVLGYIFEEKNQLPEGFQFSDPCIKSQAWLMPFLPVV